MLELLTASLAKKLADKLVDAAIGSIRRQFGKPEAKAAFDAAVAEALEEALPGFVPEGFAEDEALHTHLEELLNVFLLSDAVGDELTNLIDTRLDRDFHHQGVLDGFEEEHDLPHLDGFDPAGLLRAFVDAFEHAAARKDALQGVIRLRKLNEIKALNSRIAEATERGADELSGLRTDVVDLVKGMIDAPRVQNLQVIQNVSVLPALAGYEFLVEALQSVGYDIVPDPFAGNIAITGGEKELPSTSLVHLRDVAEKLRRVVVEAAPGPDELDVLEERYRRHVIRWFEHLTFQGMMSAPRPIVLPLEDVYVELRAVAEVPEAADAFSVDERRLLLELGESGDERGEERLKEKRRELLGQLDALRRERWSRTLPERKSMAEALHQAEQRSFVVLGDPGSGKTTLLHYLALVFARGPEVAARSLGIAGAEADRLPIFVPLAAFDDMRRQHEGLTLRDFLALYYDTRRGLPGLGPLFESAIRSGRALVLLDGLDEVIDVSTRRYMADQVSALMGEWTAGGVRFVLSSRVVGYREAPVTAQASTLTVLDFGVREIETFVRQWARAFERWAAGGESPEVTRQARNLERDLMEDVRSNPSVRLLAANPLMLTMLALLRRQVGRLPHRRIQLYESYVGTLLENWIEERSYGARDVSIERLERHQAENVLIPLALWLQEEKPSGTAGRVEIHRKLTDVYLEEEGLERETAELPRVREAEGKAERFLHEMRQMTGLIVERGHNAFGFLHLTFQEYFVGRALAQKDDASRWDVVRRHLHDPRWREPVMLCAGRLGVVENRRAQVTSLVSSILGHDNPTEGDLRRNLQLALAISCDDVYLDPKLIDRLVEAAVGCLPTGVYALDRALMGYLAQLVANKATDVEACFVTVLGAEDVRLRREAIEALSRFTGITGVRSCLIRQLDDEDVGVQQTTMNVLSSLLGSDESVRNVILEKLQEYNWKIRQAAVSALSSLSDSDETVRKAILEKLMDSSIGVRQVAIRGLSSLLDSDETVRKAILGKLKDDHWQVRQSTVSVLSSLLGSDKIVRKAILDNLQYYSYGGDHDSALSELSALAVSDEKVRKAVLKKLTDPRYVIRQSATTALSPLVASDEAVRKAILEKLMDSTIGVRQSAVSALSPLAISDETVRKVILEKITDPSSAIRQSAVSALSPLAVSNETIRKAILERLKDPNYVTRQSAIRAMSSMAVSDEAMRDVLVEKIKDPEDEVRQSAIIALSAVVGNDKTVRDALLEELKAPTDNARAAKIDESGPPDIVSHRIDRYSARLTAASFLLNRNETSDDAVELCLEALDYGIRPREYQYYSGEVRKQAALVLGKLEPLESNQRAYDKLLHVMKHDEDADVRDAAYGALVRLAQVREMGEGNLRNPNGVE